MTIIRFPGRDDHSRSLTRRNLPAGVVQALEGMVNASPTAYTLEISVRDEDDNQLGMMRLNLTATSES